MRKLFISRNIYNAIMKYIKFTFDKHKAEINFAKHGVSFIEAKSVFADEFARVIFDEEHSEYEERFIILGMSARARILIVVHCYREKDETIRIISARKATAREIKQYEELR